MHISPTQAPCSPRKEIVKAIRRCSYKAMSLLRASARRATPSSARLFTASRPRFARRTFVMASAKLVQSAADTKSAVQSFPASELRPPLSASAPVSASPAKSSLEGWSSSVPSAQPDRRHDSPDPETPTVFAFFEKATCTWQYIVADMATRQAVIIDPVLDYDPASGNVATKTADGLLGFVQDHGLNITHILCVPFPSPVRAYARPGKG